MVQCLELRHFPLLNNYLGCTLVDLECLLLGAVGGLTWAGLRGTCLRGNQVSLICKNPRRKNEGTCHLDVIHVRHCLGDVE